MFDVTFLSLNFDVGGSQRHTLDLARSLKRDHGLSIRHIGTSVARRSVLTTEEDRADLNYLDRGRLGVTGMFRALFNELRVRPTRVLVAVNQAPASAAFIARRLGVHRGATMCILHSAHLRTPAERRAQILHTQTMKRLDALIFVSRMQRSYWEANGLVSPGAKVIVNGIHIDHYASARPTWRNATRTRLGLAEEVVIGISARFRPEKNLVQLVDAIKILREHGLPAKALFVGGGPSAEEVEVRAVEIGVRDACLFVGEHDDIRPFLAAMDIGVLCSRAEVLSLAALEIMATGAPIVISRVGGAAEIVDEGVNGFLFDYGDTPAFVSHLARLIEDAGLRQAQGDAAAAIARERFGYTPMVNKYADLIAPYLNNS